MNIITQNCRTKSEKIGALIRSKLPEQKLPIAKLKALGKEFLELNKKAGEIYVEADKVQRKSNRKLAEFDTLLRDNGFYRNCMVSRKITLTNLMTFSKNQSHCQLKSLPEDVSKKLEDAQNLYNIGKRKEANEIWDELLKEYGIV